MKAKWIAGLIGLGTVTIAMVAGAMVLLAGGSGHSRKTDASLGIFVQVDPVNMLGDLSEINLLLENNGNDFLQIEEIRLPAILSDSAVVYDVFPSLYPGRHEYSDGWEQYPIGLILEPGERREFTVKFMPWQIADIAHQIQVQAGDQEFSGTFRTIFNKPVAAVQTATPDAVPTVVPTQTPTSAVELKQAAVELPYRAVVKITAKTKYSSYLRNIWGGSGSIVSEDGLILTNAHLVLPEPGMKPDVFVISMTYDPAGEPIDQYIAEPVLTDEDLDLAVMKITSDLAYNPVDWQTTKLPVVALGDSDRLQLGDDLRILGYPGIGGATITLTSGNVGGFTAEPAYGERAFIKTSASISGGTSGGMALNAAGQLVAIPTQLGSGKKEDLVDCRVVTDTNGDNQINQRDACIPVGGFINALRPINLAIPMIHNASLIQLSMK